jgi:DNA sulfur modification protein DndC
MPLSGFQKFQESLRALYLGDQRSWLVGFSGGKDSTLVAALVFEAALAGRPGKVARKLTSSAPTPDVISTVFETIETGLASCGAAPRLKS